jgi:hypothetical protein
MSRVFIDIRVNEAKPSGYFVRSDLKERIERVEGLTDSKVVGIVYDGTYTIELILNPPLEIEEGTIKADNENKKEEKE